MAGCTLLRDLIENATTGAVVKEYRLKQCRVGDLCCIFFCIVGCVMLRRSIVKILLFVNHYKVQA
jgi:hypothetical protein